LELENELRPETRRYRRYATILNGTSIVLFEALRQDRGRGSSQR
jgi:hypothetical protein